MAEEKKRSAALNPIKSIAPKLVELTEDVLFGDVWERSELSKRDRSLITIAALIALNRKEQLPYHLALGFENGLSREEIGEIITHIAFYAGWPVSVSAATIAKKIFEERK